MELQKELDTYESSVRYRQYEKSLQQFLKILESSSVHRTKRDIVFSNLNENEVFYVATRIVSTTFQLFMDSGFLLSEDGFRRLSYFGRNFSMMVAMTPYKNSDHIIRHLIGQSESGAEKKDSIDLYSYRKMLFLWSIYSDVQIPFESFMRDHQNLLKYVLFNALTLNCYVDKDVHRRRENLLELMADDKLALDLDDKSVAFAGPMWMYTAYATTKKKHDAKRVINRAYRQWVLSKGVKEPSFTGKRKIVERPTIVVIMEQMNRNHAMFRCFGDSFYALKEHFNLVGMGVEGEINEDVHDAFHKFVAFPKAITEIKKYVGQVVKQKPDIILYVSLGMQNATIPLATMRLAPIQMMLLAHPAPSRIPTIDYVIVEEGLIRKDTEYTEKLIWMKSGDFVLRDTFDSQLLHSEVKLRRGNHPNRVKVAIPSFAMKISDPFISVLERIAEETNTEVEFNFFPYLIDMPYEWFKESVQKRIPSAVIHLPKGYREYILSLGECDIHLGSFPFNNSNGNIDSVKMGLPMVVLEQDTTEGAMDAMMLRHMNAPEEAIAQSVEAYIEKAVLLIDDLEARLDLQDKFEKVDLEATYFNGEKAGGIVKAIENVYTYHDLIQSSEQKVIKFDEFIPSVSLDKVSNQ